MGQNCDLFFTFFSPKTQTFEMSNNSETTIMKFPSMNMMHLITHNFFLTSSLALCLCCACTVSNTTPCTTFMVSLSVSRVPQLIICKVYFMLIRFFTEHNLY